MAPTSRPSSSTGRRTLVEGRTLDALIPSGGLPLDRILAYATPLGDAVGAARQRGITHRDLKPGNVMIGDDGRVLRRKEFSASRDQKRWAIVRGNIASDVVLVSERE